MTTGRRRSTGCLRSSRICTKIRGTSSRCGAWVGIAAPSEAAMSNILTRRQTHFVLWCPAVVATAPELIIGQLQNGNPPTFKELARKVLQAAAVGGGLFELD